MSRATRRAVGLPLGIAIGLSAPVLAAGSLPYRVAVATTWGEGAGSDAFRNDLAHALGDTLSHNCFSAVAIVDDDPEGTKADLLLNVSLSDVQEELRFEQSIAGSLQPGEPSNQLRRVARYTITVQTELETLETRRPIENKHLVADISRRPMVIGEDPQVTARQLAIERIVSDLKKTYCRGGSKLLHKIQLALAEPPPGAPKSR